MSGSAIGYWSVGALFNIHVFVVFIHVVDHFSYLILDLLSSYLIFY